MMKKVSAVLLAIMLSCFAALASAQPGALPQEAIDAFAKEPPLTQADVDAYLKALPQLPKAVSAPDGMSKLAKDLGLSEMRLPFIMARIGIAHSLALGVTAEQLGLDKQPEIIRPTESDKALVQANFEELTRVTQEMRAAQGQ